MSNFIGIILDENLTSKAHISTTYKQKSTFHMYTSIKLIQPLLKQVKVKYISTEHI